MKVAALCFVLVIAVAGITGGCSRPAAEMCVVCQRETCQGVSATVELRSGKQIRCCCPRCALSYARTAGNEVAALKVHDFSSGRSVNAEEAVFVEGSDFNHCAATCLQRLPDGGVAVSCYDRCQPGLLAFADREAAAAFAAQHGGRVLNYAAIKPR